MAPNRTTSAITLRSRSVRAKVLPVMLALSLVSCRSEWRRSAPRSLDLTQRLLDLSPRARHAFEKAVEFAVDQRYRRGHCWNTKSRNRLRTNCGDGLATCELSE